MQRKKLILAILVLVSVLAVVLVVLTINGQREKVHTDQEIARLEAEATKDGINIPLFTLLPQPQPNMKGTNASPIYIAIGKIFDNTGEKYFRNSSQKRGQISEYAFGLIAKTLLTADKQFLPQVGKILAASKMPYCLAPHAPGHDSVLDVDNTPDPAAEPFPELADYKWSAKILAIDASAASCENDLPRAKKDLDGLKRMAAQILQQKSIIGLLVSRVIQQFAADVAFGDLEQHPSSAAWAQLAISTDRKLMEFPMLSSLPFEWLTDVQISTDIRTGDPRKIEYLGQLATGLSSDEIPNEVGLKVLNFILHPDYNQMSVAFLKDALISIRLSRLQYCNIQKWKSSERSLLDHVPTSGGNLVLHFFVSNMAGAISIGPRMVMKRRLRMSLIDVAEQAFLVHATTGVWPDHLVFPRPAFQPPKRPLVNPESAKPMPTGSPINPFDGKPLQYKRIPNGFIVSTKLSSWASASSFGNSSSQGPEIAKIEWSNGKLITKNLPQ